jgi:hypothetical protein
MTEEKRKKLIADHREIIIGILRDLGYCCQLNPLNMNIQFYGGTPSQEEFDRANYGAFLILREDERDKGNDLELFDLIY